jgi:hypothetical protein
MLFHLGLIIIVPAIFIAPKVRYTAVIDALQGVSVSMEDAELVNIIETPFKGGTSPFVFFRLDEYETVFEDKIYAVDYKADVTIGYMQAGSYNEQKAFMGINRPVTLNGYKYLLEVVGFAPRFIFKDKEDNVLLDSFIRLLNNTKDVDSFDVKEANMRVLTRFFPDMYEKEGKVGTLSREIKNPAFGIKVIDKKTSEVIFSGVLKKGGSVEFMGMELVFKDLKPFVVVRVVKDPTYYLLLIGWCFGLIGLILKYIPSIAPPKVRV